MTAPETMTMSCPSEETLAAFVDGRLNGEARRRVVEHMASCDDCRDIVVMAAEHEAQETPAFNRANSTHPRYAGFAAAAALVVVVGTIVQTRLSSATMNDLVEASASLTVRELPARLSADFPYRIYQGPTRSGSSASHGDEQFWRIQAVGGKVQAKAGNDPSAAQLHVMGVSALLARNYDHGVRMLEAAVRKETGESAILSAIRQSRDASLLNDLAVGYDALIQRYEKRQYQAAALEAVTRAWALAKTPEIAFTRATVLQTLSVRAQAIEAWKEYLALDDHPDWKAEAQRKLDGLLEPDEATLWPAARAKLWAGRLEASEIRSIVASFPQQVRLWCEDELLPAWGTAHRRKDSAVTGDLERIAVLGRALSEVNGVRDVDAAVQAILAASPADRDLLAIGHEAYGAGRRGVVSPAAGEALQALDEALQALTPARTPFAWRARAEHAGAVYHSNAYEKAARELADVLRNVPPEAASDPLRARIDWMLGLIAQQAGNPVHAVEHYQTAVAVYERLGERDFESMMRSQLAAALERAGRPAEAVRERHRALALLGRTGNRNRLHAVMFEAAFAAVRHDQPALAELFLDATVAHDLAVRDFVTASTSTIWRAAFRFRRGEHEAAASDLQEARSVTVRIGDRHARERALANVAVAQIALRPEHAAPQELAELDRAIDFYRRSGGNVWLGAAYVSRARARAAAGNASGAERDFLLALNEVSRARTAIQARDARMSFTATTDDVTDRYVDFLLDRHREADAFEVADSNRVRELTDAPGSAWQGVPANILGAAQRALPPATAIVEYRVTPTRIAAWLIRSDGFEAVVLSTSPAAIWRLLDRLDGRAAEQQAQELMGALYAALLRPLEPHLQDVSTLVIVPDDRLERVPYAALYDVASGYVVQRRATAVAPSVALFLQSCERYVSRAAQSERVLVVQAAAGGNVEALPEAAREARVVASLYPEARTFREDATPEVLLDAAAVATLIHFAGHGLGGDDSLRALRLGENAVLDERRVLGARLPRARMVYLSACATDLGPVFESEGSATIARSFFEAGVPAVVATLWPVDDVVAYRIAQSFHEHLRAGSAPAEALRAAQASLLAQQTAWSFDWAAFRVIGAGISVETNAT